MITSLQNHQVKIWRSLHQRKHRERLQLFLIEGHHLIEEGLKSNWPIEHVIVSDVSRLPENIDESLIVLVSDEILNQLSQTRSPQGILAVVRMKKPETIKGNELLLIDGIQDPGNLGTIIRTASAAGYDGIILGDGTVDPFNDKVIRATQGSIFQIPIIQTNLIGVIPELQLDNFQIIASALENAQNIEALDKPQKFALVLGNEGAGISSEVLSMSDSRVKIPIYGQAESLNVSVAAGILMYMLK